MTTDTAYKSTANDPALYNDAADVWWDGSVRWVRTLRNLVPARMAYFKRAGLDWDGKRVLDLGCGGGFMAEALSDEGAQVTGVDPAADALAAARAHAEQTGKSISYLQGVGEAIPVDDNSQDAVVCVDVLEHVSDLDTVLEEVARVLVPGGAFAFDTINRNPLATAVVIWAAERVFRILPRGTHDPRLFIKPSELRAKLEARGFAVEPFKGLGPTGLNGKLDFTFGTLPVTAIQYLGVARLRE